MEGMDSGGYGDDSRTKCLDKATELDDTITWMIVAEVRSHSGTERYEIG